MNIAIFCSANDVDEKYTKPAKELAGLIAGANHTLIWGGSDCGLMRVVADGAQENGGKIVGVSMELFKDIARENADEMIVTKDLAERKEIIMERSDALVVLVGGLGTLDEMTEMIEHKRHGRHANEIIVLNTDGFYDGLKTQMQRMASEGFLPVAELGESKAASLSRWVRFVDTPQEVMELIR